MIFDTRPCTLGEGPLWHPERQQLFWFDIIGKRLMTRSDAEPGAGPEEWQFAEHCSAAGWIDRDRLLIASEIALFRFILATGIQMVLGELGADFHVESPPELAAAVAEVAERFARAAG